MPKNLEPELTEAEISRRMDNAVRRALNTPPKPLKKIVGKGKHAAEKGTNPVKKAARSKPKAP